MKKLIEMLQINGWSHQWLRRKKDQLLLPSVKLLTKYAIQPRTVSLVGLVVGVLGMGGLFLNYWIGVGVLLLSALCDGIDGALARYTKTTSLQGQHLDYYIDLVLALGLYVVLLLYTQQWYWVVGFDLFAVLLLANFLAGNKLQVAPMRMALVLCLLTGLPWVGFAVVTGYAVVMMVILGIKLIRKA